MHSLDSQGSKLFYCTDEPEDLSVRLTYVAEGMFSQVAAQYHTPSGHTTLK